MAFQFPWTNLHELNLDWFLSKFKQFTDNFLATTATAESVPYGTQPSVTVTGGELDEDTDVTDPFTFNFKIPAGEPGAQGEQGEKGDKGDKGDTGFPTDAQVATAVDSWLDDNVTQETGYVLDRTLTMSNAAAPADLVGDLTSAILDCFENVAWASADGETAYNYLKDIFNGDIWIITNNLTNCVNSNPASSITKGANYTATITSVSANALESAVVSITMSGIDITASVYNHGVINIPNVTGNVQITITVAEGYTLYGYITQTGSIPNNNGIITDIALSTDYTFETSVLYNNTSGTLYPMMGTRVGGSTKQFALYVQPSTTRLAYWFSGTDSSTYITGLNSNVKNEIIVKPIGTSATYPNNAVIELNETEYNTTSTATNVTFSPWFTLFGYGQSASTSANMGDIQLRIGETIVKSGNTVIYDLIPAYNGEKYGFYELINDKFYFGADATLYTGGNW